MSLLIATGNPGKLREFRALLSPLSLVSPSDLGIDLEVEETGSSFSENAELKARAFARSSGMICLADDSGLAVAALEGAPGVYSARYGGCGLDDRDRCLFLLEQLKGFSSPAQRKARFRCCVAAAAPDGRFCRAEGICEGYIAFRPAGEGGFGYDPIFYLPEYGRTMAQIPPDLKNRLSHRARAVRAIRPLLRRTFPELRNGFSTAGGSAPQTA